MAMAMRKLLAILGLLAVLLPGLAVPQATGEPPANPDTVTDVDDEAEASGDDEPGDDDDRVLETDDESYLDIDEEDFRPSEEIPTDQSIAFPVDI